MNKRILVNAIIYIIVTAFFLYIWIRQKALAERIRIWRNHFGEMLATALRIRSEKTKKKLQKGIDFIESVLTALCLVLLIQHFYIGNFKVPTPSMVPTIAVGDRMFANMAVYKFFDPEEEDIIVFKEPMTGKINYTKRLMAGPGDEVQIYGGHLYVNGQENSERFYSNLPITSNLPRSMQENDKWRVPKKGDVLHIIPNTNYKQLFAANNLDATKIQKAIMKDASYAFILAPDVEFYINGEETGPILDFFHDSSILNRLLSGEEVVLPLQHDYYFALGDNTDHSADSRVWGFVREEEITGKIIFRFWPLNRMGLLQ